MTYPEHIYDPTRREIGRQLIVKEWSKLLPGIDPTHLQDATTGWQERPTDYHLEDDTRDFWDIFSATIESIKLKPGFTPLLTAANYSWEHREVEVDTIGLSAPLEQIMRIPNLEWHDGLPVHQVVSATKETGNFDEQKAIIDQHSTSPIQNAYPIIVHQDEGEKLRVIDGNRRSLRAGLYGKTALDAWVCTTNNEAPRDYWVPLNDLFQLAETYRLAKNNAEQQSVRNALELIFCASSVAKTTYQTRVSGYKWADELLSVEPTI